MWFLFQTAVFFAVMAYFIENDMHKGFGYPPAFVAGFIAWMATIGAGKLIDLVRLRREKTARPRIGQHE